MRPRTNKHAFTIIELILTLTMLSVFSLLSAKLFTSTIVVARNSRQAQSMLLRHDSIVHRLRHDMWNAESLSVNDPHTATIRQPGKQQITWRRSDATDVLSRTLKVGQEILDHQQWTGLDMRLSFAKDGSTLIIQRPRTRTDWDVLVRLYSQLTIAHRKKS